MHLEALLPFIIILVYTAVFLGAFLPFASNPPPTGISPTVPITKSPTSNSPTTVSPTSKSPTVSVTLAPSKTPTKNPTSGVACTTYLYTSPLNPFIYNAEFTSQTVDVDFFPLEYERYSKGTFLMEFTTGEPSGSLTFSLDFPYPPSPTELQYSLTPLVLSPIEYFNTIPLPTFGQVISGVVPSNCTSPCSDYPLRMYVRIPYCPETTKRPTAPTPPTEPVTKSPTIPE